MKLEYCLEKERNNFDLLRWIAASAVIFGHAHAIVVNGNATDDNIHALLGFDYSGSLAVKFFFFLSGLVVTNSVVKNPHALKFFLSRIFRIFPGLIVCVLLSTFVIGVCLTSLTWKEYLVEPQTYSYVRGAVRLTLDPWQLPGVFQSNNQHAVNGSLWTLPIEVFLYVCLFSLMVSASSKTS